MSADRMAWLRLVRFPAPTSALTDVLAGAGIAGVGLAQGRIGLVLGASCCLYAGGMALNDFADRARDATLRPERPIPSGQIGSGGACAIGFGLLAGGIGLAAAAGTAVAFTAAAVALAVLAYDFALKRSRLTGPLGMGLCRGGNLLLGGSLLWPAASSALLFGAAGLTAYVICLTGASLAEDGALSRRWRGVLLTGMIAALSAPYWAGPRSLLGLAALLPAAGVLLSHWRALAGPTPGRFVRWGVLCIMLLDAGFLLAAGQWRTGLACIALFGVSLAWPRARID